MLGLIPVARQRVEMALLLALDRVGHVVEGGQAEALQHDLALLVEKADVLADVGVVGALRGEVAGGVGLWLDAEAEEAGGPGDAEFSD